MLTVHWLCPQTLNPIENLQWFSGFCTCGVGQGQSWGVGDPEARNSQGIVGTDAVIAHFILLTLTGSMCDRDPTVEMRKSRREAWCTEGHEGRSYDLDPLPPHRRASGWQPWHRGQHHVHGQGHLPHTPRSPPDGQPRTWSCACSPRCSESSHGRARRRTAGRWWFQSTWTASRPPLGRKGMVKSQRHRYHWVKTKFNVHYFWDHYPSYVKSREWYKCLLKKKIRSKENQKEVNSVVILSYDMMVV